jgi:hypothetical protein
MRARQGPDRALYPDMGGRWHRNYVPVSRWKRNRSVVGTTRRKAGNRYLEGGLARPISNATETLGTSQRGISITGRFLLDHTGHFVYIWERGGFPLYIGKSSGVLGRLGRHDVIGVLEPILATDNVLLYQCETAESATKLETRLIYELRPKYNKNVITPIK